MDCTEYYWKENPILISQEISNIINKIEEQIILCNKGIKECEEIKILKQKCCSEKPMISLTAFQAMNKLVAKKVLSGTQTISILISLLPSVTHYSGLVTTIGNILLLDLREQLAINKNHHSCSLSEQQHPLVLILKSSKEKSWLEIFFFIHNLWQTYEEINIIHKINVVRPLFHYVFWSPDWSGSNFQRKLFDSLMLELNKKEILNFVLEILIFQNMDISYCLFLQQFFIHLLNNINEENKAIITALLPNLAEATKWIILNAYNPYSWICLLKKSIQFDVAPFSVVLHILTDIVLETPSTYITDVADICKFIICGTSCNRYLAYRFIALALNWAVSPSILASPFYKLLQDILFFLNENPVFKDHTHELLKNKYFKNFGNYNKNVKFAVDLVLVSNSWLLDKNIIIKWLQNMKESNEKSIQLKLHSYLYSIILCENEKIIINHCLEILLNLIEHYKDVSFTFLCLLFYKLGREIDPAMQKKYLLSLPKLAVKKENIPLIIKIIESLKKGNPKIMTPLSIQLFLTLWKYDNRTYSFLHRALQNTSDEFNWELNISKAIALKEICQVSPHLYAKDVVSTLSTVLNECTNDINGLPSAITIEAVTELCKASVIDISGTWNALQPKLSVDKRPNVILALCNFFSEIPGLSSSGIKCSESIRNIIPLIWSYTFFKDKKVVRHAFLALSKFEIENFELKLLPEPFRGDIDLLRSGRNSDLDLIDGSTLLELPYVPAPCWLLFLEKLNNGILAEGATLLIVIVERELNSLPRGLFYLPPEKSEPLNYSYLPQNSVCRVLVDRLQKISKSNFSNVAPYLKEVIRIVSFEYKKVLPPLNWSFVSNFMNLETKLLLHVLELLLKQSPVSPSAKSVIESYLISTHWNMDKAPEILLIYSKIKTICKIIPCNMLQSFLKKTIECFVQSALKSGCENFEKILSNLSDAFKADDVLTSHKILMAKQLVGILKMIPPNHKILENYALCASEFPMTIIDSVTSVASVTDIKSDWFQRAVTIRYYIALQSDVTNPLVWFNELLDCTGVNTELQNFILIKVLSIMRHRRKYDHTVWLQELMWRIQASAATAESNPVKLFLIDVFVSAVIVLSGYDCLFNSLKEVVTNTNQKIEQFPQALSLFSSLPQFISLLPKVSLWLQKISKWMDLPQIYYSAFAECILFLNNANEAISIYPRSILLERLIK